MHHATRLIQRSLVVMGALVAVLAGDQAAADPSTEVVLASEVEWGPLNPARGDASPRAGNLWGDRAEDGATGFLVKFVDGFSSPPHIHNVTYRGVVIRGQIHNDDPQAEKMWMSAGSYWTQPAGESHITAARGGDNLAYIEIQEGPYLVRPTEQAFDNGERPINVDASNLVWLGAADLAWIDPSGAPDASDGVEVAFLWGDPKDDRPSGSLVKLPAGFVGTLHSHGPTFRVVVIAGQPRYHGMHGTDTKTLEPGSSLGSKGEATHPVSADAEAVLYVRSEGRYRIAPTPGGSHGQE